MHRLAVLIPVYNDQRGLDAALDSLRQESEVFDVYVVDDGSVPPIEVAADLPFRVTVIRMGRNAGIAAALNAGLREIDRRGYRFVARLDAADTSLPGRLAAQLEFLERHPDHALVGCQAEIVDVSGRLLYLVRPPSHHRDLVGELCRRNPLVHPSVMMRTEAVEQVGCYDEALRTSEDYDLFCRISKSFKVGSLDRVGVRCVVSINRTSGRRWRQARMSRLRVQLAHFPIGPWGPAIGGIMRSLVMLPLPWSLSVRGRALGGFFARRWRARSVF
jgi:glycosyltransferase involved in cell wall biosynthesis